ncbi:MAG: ATP-binding cassette domain-containing protein [Clostridia bacterium]|nr:ATP-binding cassette domain-containing protein [Clostridia bacterium]
MKNEKEKRKYSRIGSIVWALKRLWGIDRRFVFFIFAAIPFIVAVPLFSSYFTKLLLDALERGAGYAELVGIVVGFMLGFIMLDHLRALLNTRVSSRQYYPSDVYQTEMLAFVRHDMDYENNEKQEFKKIYQYAHRDACSGNCALEFLWRDITDFLVALIGIGTYGSLLGVLEPALFLIVLAVSTASYFTTRWQPKYYEKHKREFEKEQRKLGYLKGLSENFAAAKDIKLYDMEPWLDAMVRDFQSYVLMWEKKCSLRGLLASVLAGLMSFLQNGAAYVFLIGTLLAGELTVGDFVFYFGIVGSIAGFLQGIIKSIAKLSTRAEKIDYYRDLFSYPNKMNYGEGCALPEGAVKIELRDVWYRYDGAEDFTLKGINLTIERGESIALVGMNGAGKTTLIKLICGFYLPTKGEILVNGRKIEEYNIHEYYSMICAVFQEIKPIAFSMFEFVASADLMRENAREEAVDAMKKAGIWEKIESLENGIDTHLIKGIYDDGVDLSGGEMQKLVLARAIYKNGGILILDEPTAALDPIAENNLYLQYRALTQGKTSIYISHRFASTRFCDRIILLEKGTVTESGTHDELMARNGQYAYMFGVQAKYYKEGEIHA